MHKIGLLSASVASLVTATAILGVGIPQASAQSPANLVVTPTLIANGLTSPVSIAAPDDGSGRIFVGEQSGIVRVISNGAISPTVMMDISSNVQTGGEQGLLSIATSPNFAVTKTIYVTFNDKNAARAPSGYDVKLGRATLTNASDNTVAGGSYQEMLAVPQPRANHNGGSLVFGPAGYLYMSTGDGGGGGDPDNAASDITKLSGKILRLDTTGGCAGSVPYYCVPSTNPYYSTGSANRDLVFAIGLRNPWKISVDAPTNNVWIGDVGQGAYEEVNVLSETPSTADFGWACKEANASYNAGRCTGRTMTAPVAVLSHVASESLSGWAEIGGYVYRGSAQTAMSGAYIFGDYVTGKLFAYQDGATARVGTLTHVSTFGQTSSGELLAASLDGGLYALTASRTTVSTTPARPVQQPRSSCVRAPGKLPRFGTTKLAKPNCRTDQGARISVSISGKLRGKAKLVRSNKGVFVRTSGRNLRITLRWSSASTATHDSYTLSRSYRVR